MSRSLMSNTTNSQKSGGFAGGHRKFSPSPANSNRQTKQSNAKKQSTALVAQSQDQISQKATVSVNDRIKVCIRVRPLLPHERTKEEAVYFPVGEDAQGLEVSEAACIFL